MSRRSAASSASNRLTRTLRGRIHRGEWAIGSRVPSVRAIAGEFGVSINTVQRAFGQLEAEQLIECRQRRAGFVKARRSRVVPLSTPGGTQVGVLYTAVRTFDPPPDPHASWTYGILRGADAALKERKFTLTHLKPPAHPSRLLKSAREQLNRLKHEMIGLICFEDAFTPELVEELDRRKMPWVTINRPDPYYQHNFVTSDHAGAGLQAGRCFVNQGMRRLLLIGTRLATSIASRESAAGFVQSFFEVGAPLHTIDYLDGPPPGEKFEAWAHAAMEAYLDRNGKPEGVFCLNDWLALGAMRACRERGLRVPRDVSFLGATGLAIGAEADPPLTVLAQPLEGIGRAAVEMLLEMHRDGVRRLPGVILPPLLLVRKSLLLSADARSLVRGRPDTAEPRRRTTRRAASTRARPVSARRSPPSS